MRLEGWHAMVFLAMSLMVVAVIVGLTLLVMWTVRRAWKRSSGEDSGSSIP